jgi:hypothetical protein
MQLIIDARSTFFIYRWLAHVDGSPGINGAVLKTLELKAKQSPQSYTNVALMLDAMAIRQQLVYSPSQQKMLGTVDLGLSEGNEVELAKEALVFMVVGLRGGWKAPVAYYFTNTLSSATQKELLLHCVEALHSVGVFVRTLTMDGHATNLGMCRQLGCTLNVESMNPTFTHPVTQQIIYVLLDPVHMIKLTRNLLQSSGILLSEKGLVEWRYVAHLEALQSEAGLNMANKLTKRHVHFQREKMKVRLVNAGFHFRTH